MARKKIGLGTCCETTGCIWVSGANNSFDSTIQMDINLSGLSLRYSSPKGLGELKCNRVVEW